MTDKEFIEEIKLLGINPTQEQLSQLEEYYNLLIEWNNKMNLTRITEKKEVYLKHFYDSLTINKIINLNDYNTLCDIGTGAGFPGIVLKIFYPHLEITLVDAREKKLKFLDEVIKKLNLKNISTKHIRAEEYSEKFDIVTARAVANIQKLLDYTMHLVKKNGYLIALKGDIDSELVEEVQTQINKQYTIKNIIKFNLPVEGSKRSLILIKNK
ncbi:MAG: 16S rRNA (guanine(527)-N(7))-methyltransferase RsmG [Bacilli bacterium]|nr:16S rRNA (guanine(527)-N(7))-methyltransferase RsmG [Bacilli bacterium]MBQ6538682.1 16S rRNA (guanine(527)-N(7))-methyltransferase RsmG [Bacilli bacterium]